MSLKVSVVIPTYRRPALLANCLDALLKQQLQHDAFEIIVVSDGPDELTQNVLKLYIEEKLPLIKYYHLPVKKGPAAARNYGWRQSTGKFIAFTDDDCIPEKRWLISFCEAGKINLNTVFTGKTIVPLPAKPTDHELNTANLQNADFITANCCCPKVILEKVGGFDERFTMAWREDSDLEFRLIMEKIQILKVQDAVVLHPVRKAAWGISIREQKKTMFNALLYKKFPDLYRKKIQIKPPYNYYVIILSLVVIIISIFLRSYLLFLLGLTTWLILTGNFINKRLASTSLSKRHVLEMTITSVAIPFLSIYWHVYGAIKYRVLFI